MPVQALKCRGRRGAAVRCAGCAAGVRRTRWWGAPPAPPPRLRSGPRPREPLLQLPRVRQWRRTAPRCMGACGRMRVCGEGTQTGKRPRDGGAATRGRASRGGGGNGARGRKRMEPPFGPGDAEVGERVAFPRGLVFGTLPRLELDIVRLNHGTAAYLADCEFSLFLWTTLCRDRPSTSPRPSSLTLATPVQRQPRHTEKFSITSFILPSKKTDFKPGQTIFKAKTTIF